MPEVLLVRAQEADDKDGDALRELGIAVVADPYLTVRPCADVEAPRRVDHVLNAIAVEAGWLIVTSQAALRALTSIRSERDLNVSIRAGQQRGLRVATVGDATRAALEDAGAVDVVVPPGNTAEALRRLLLRERPTSAIAPQGTQAMKGLSAGLREAGWSVDEQVVYETATVDQTPATAVALAQGVFAAVVLRSPTAARAVAHFVGTLPATTAAICGGPTTAAEVERLGLGTVVVSDGPSATDVARAVQTYLATQH